MHLLDNGIVKDLLSISLVLEKTTATRDGTFVDSHITLRVES